MLPVEEQEFPLLGRLSREDSKKMAQFLFRKLIYQPVIPMGSMKNASGLVIRRCRFNPNTAAPGIIDQLMHIARLGLHAAWGTQDSPGGIADGVLNALIFQGFMTDIGNEMLRVNLDEMKKWIAKWDKEAEYQGEWNGPVKLTTSWWSSERESRALYYPGERIHCVAQAFDLFFPKPEPCSASAVHYYECVEQAHAYDPLHAGYIRRDSLVYLPDPSSFCVWAFEPSEPTVVGSDKSCCFSGKMLGLLPGAKNALLSMGPMRHYSEDVPGDQLGYFQGLWRETEILKIPWCSYFGGTNSSELCYSRQAQCDLGRTYREITTNYWRKFQQGKKLEDADAGK